MKKPTPKSVMVQCSVCGLDWAKHEQKAKAAKRVNPNLDDCVVLLKEALVEARRTRYPLGVSATGVNAVPTTAPWAVVPPL